MRRLTATMLNGTACIFITVIFYMLAAMLRRWILMQSRLTELYSPQAAIPLSLALLGFPLLAGIVYYLFIKKSKNYKAIITLRYNISLWFQWLNVLKH